MRSKLEGFEKFIKNLRKEKKQDNEPQSKKGEDVKKDEQNEDTKKKEEELDEEEDELKPKKKEEEKKDEKKTTKNAFTNYFIEPGSNKPKYENIWIFLAAAFATLYLIDSINKPKEIVYQDFINNYLLKSNVKMITLTKDKTNESFNYKVIVETNDGGQKLYLTLGNADNFLANFERVQREMGKQPSEFVPLKFGDKNAEAPSFGNTIFLLVAAFFLFTIIRSMRSGGAKNAKNLGGQDSGTKNPFKGGGGLSDYFGYGKSNAQVYGTEKKIKTKFRHVAGMESAKKEVTEFVDFLKDPKKYTKLGARIPRGALLIGPPGTGKTLLAKAVAGEAGVPFFSISGSDFVEMFVGVGASRVRDLFKKAREKAPSIIFIDEIDAVGKKRHGKYGGGNDERDNTLNQLLVEMDGFSTDASVIILAATNRKDILDSALLRPGRFDRTVEINLPDIKEREEIFKVHLKKIKMNVEKPVSEYARKLSALTPGMSGADISNVCNEGAIIAARKNLESVSLKEFESATERVIGGLEKKTVMTAEERKTVAYHEAGHAVVGWFLPHSNPLIKITIIPRSKGSLGFAQYLPDELSLYSKEQLTDMICTALGGRASEEVFFTRITTGAHDDIKKITGIAHSMVAQFGMNERLGLIAYQQEEMMQKPYSEHTNRIIDDEVRLIVDACYLKTKKILEEQKEKVAALAEELLAKETISLPDIIKILGARPYPMKESIREYLEEITHRQEEEEEAKKKKAEDDEDHKNDGGDKHHGGEAGLHGPEKKEATPPTPPPIDIPSTPKQPDQKDQ